MTAASTDRSCPVCASPLMPLAVPLRLVWEGEGHDTMAEALVCSADDRHPGLIMEPMPRRLASGAIRRLAWWGEQDRTTRARGLVRL